MAQGQVTRQRLLDAAAALIGEVGWNAVTTRMAAERAGVRSGVVHYHFASVDDLLVAASLGVAGALLRSVSDELAGHDDPGEAVDWLLAELGRYGPADPASLLMVEMYLAATRMPELREQLGDMVLEFRRVVAGWLRERGFPGDADAAAVLLAAVIDGLMLHRGLDPRLDLTAVGAPLRALFGKDDTEEA